MDGFKNTTRMRTFTSSADVGRTAGRTVGFVRSFAQGGSVRGFARGGHAKDKIDGEHDVTQVDPNHADRDMHGHGLVHREEPTTDELGEAGGTSPLKSGYAKGGKPAKHFHVHHHYHSGGKTNTKSKHYGGAEKEAERQVEGAGPMMATGGTRNTLKGGGKSKIHIKAKNKGALHRDMGVPEGKKIPKGAIRSKLARDKAHHNTKGVKRDVFALNFGHAEGGHIHDDTHIPSNYPDYATGGTINELSAGGGAYGGMATGGTINPMAVGGMPQRGVMVGAPPGGSALAGPPGAMPGQGGALAARRAALMGRPMPGAIGARPIMRAGGGKVSATEARSIARGEVGRHVGKPAPMGHKGLAKMIDKC